jgi:hypothetical protein
LDIPGIDLGERGVAATPEVVIIAGPVAGRRFRLSE